ncbi:MAG: vWA domain-containing protein [Terriglobales bacterium]
MAETARCFPNWQNQFIYLLAVVCLLLTSLYGETDACLARTTLISVSGTNASESLNAADFKVSVGGKIASVQSAKPADRPPRVVILVDASANHDQSTWAVAQALVDEFLAEFPDAGDFTLLRFDDKVEKIVHATNRAALQGAWGEMFPSGKRESEAGLVEALKRGSESLGAYRQGDAELLVVTSDQIHKETEQVLSQQTAAGIRLFAASFDQSRRYGPNRFGLDMQVENYSPLEAMAKASGGMWIWFDMSRQDTTATLQSATTAGKSAATLVRNYVALELRLASPITKPEKLKIDLAKGKGKAPDRSTTYPREIFPCQ